MKKNFSVPKKQTRAVEASPQNLDVEARTMEFSFSSEVPYERWFGLEIISHEKGAMNLERLEAHAPLLFNHDWDKQIGVIEKVWIGADKRGYVKVRFSKSQFADEKFQDAQDGILRGVSFGYMVEEMVLTKKSDDGPNEYTVTKCLPYEVSCVTIPADYSVGIGRGRSIADEGEEVLNVVLEEEEEESEEAKQLKIKNAQIEAERIEAEKREKSLAAVAVLQERKKMENLDAVKQERERVAAIRALGKKLKMEALGEELASGENSLEQAKSAFLERMGMSQKPVSATDGEVGLSANEKKQFSFVRAINALANPNSKEAQDAAGFEREISIAAGKLAGKEVRGIMIPVDMLRHTLQRDLLAGTSTAGGHLIQTDLMSGSFIELLRKKSILQRAGAQALNGLNGNIAIPRMTGAATAYWVGEGSAPTESQQAFDQVAMTPKTVGAFTDFSRKLMLQSSIEVESMVRNDLSTVLSLEIDRVGLYGSGSANQPLGLTGVTGLNIVDLAATVPTFAEMVAMETLIASDNADVDVMKYLINAAGRGALKTKEKASGYPQYVLENGQINGYGTECSNQIAAGDFFFGNWADLIIGFWSGLDLMIDPYAGATSGNMRVIAHQDVDIAARHGESFARAYEVP